MIVYLTKNQGKAEQRSLIIHKLFLMIFHFIVLFLVLHTYPCVYAHARTYHTDREREG